MKAIIDLILKHYSFVDEEKIHLPHLKFYKHSSKNIANYFLINYIDCSSLETEVEKVKDALEMLEKEYTSSIDKESKPLKIQIQECFNNNQESSQIDKNTSAIYLVKFNDLKSLDQYRNLVYAIEESPYYFKRYIIPFTEIQVDQLRKMIGDFAECSIAEVLSEIANSEDEYYKLLEGKNSGSVYDLVIRLFSKLPFLQYKFKADTIPIPIDNAIAKKVEGELEKYHNAIKNREYSLDQLLELENDFIVDDEIINKELNKLIGGV